MPKFSGTNRRPRRPNLTAPIRTLRRPMLTHEGGTGFLRDPESELFLLAATNMMGEDTFYERADERDARCTVAYDGPGSTEVTAEDLTLIDELVDEASAPVDRR